MISPPRARRLIARCCRPLAPRRIPVARARDLTLAEDVCATFALPRFDNSQMDGYALRAEDVKQRPAHLAIVGAVHAGIRVTRALRAGETMAIMTGARVPRGANAVVPKEEVTVSGDTLVVTTPVRSGRHVRRRGEEVARDAVVLRSGIQLHPGALGCLSALGKSYVRAIPRPTVTVIATGDEIIAPGERLTGASVYDATSTMLTAALQGMGHDAVTVQRVGDNASRLRRAFARALATSDVLVVVGGVSVGDRDFVREALSDNGVDEIFWRVAQKPGKPIYFGVSGRKLVFGLPGNPASAFTCFYFYVYEALRRLSGVRRPALRKHVLPLAAAVDAHPKLWLLLKGACSADARAVKLRRQGSHMITSLARSDRLIVVPPGRGCLPAGTPVDTYAFPFAEGVAS